MLHMFISDLQRCQVNCVSIALPEITHCPNGLFMWSTSHDVSAISMRVEPAERKAQVIQHPKSAMKSISSFRDKKK